MENRDQGEIRDLRNTLLIGGLVILVFGGMLFATESLGGVLQIPTLPNALAALGGAVVTAAGLAALRARLPVRSIAWGTLVGYTLVIALTVHFTGGPLTPMPALYLLVVVAASFLLGLNGALVIALLSVVSYALVLLMEYSGLLSMVLIWRQEFDPRERGVLLVVNWLAVAIPAIFTAQLGGTLAQRLKTSNAHLRESERLRESMIQMIVHDLRNPLTALMGGVEVLRLMMREQMGEEQRQLLENARRSGHLLFGMVEELLDVSRMEAGMMQPAIKPVDLNGLILEEVENTRLLAEQDGVTVEADVGEGLQEIPCDPSLVRRVLANLLSNGLKYTPAGGRITVAARREGDEAVVSVSDTGIGISPRYHQAIFEKFGMASAPHQERRGTGLGLAFCKMAVEAHGGEIRVESRLGQGATFTFTLPRGPAPEPGLGGWGAG